jgi:hypothetical protein
VAHALVLVRAACVRDMFHRLCLKSEKTACSRARLDGFIALQSRDRKGAGFDTACKRDFRFRAEKPQNG